MAESKQNTNDKPQPKPVVLELRNVSFASRAQNSIRLHNANLVIRESELVMVDIDRSQNCRDVASMLQGLQQPTLGDVRFRNEDWRGADFDRHFRMRSRIGRVFEDHAWIQNSNVLDNLTLASRHHRIADVNINQQVKSWADRFGVNDISHDRPAFVDPSVLQIYQWIRALICKPALLILERPMNLVPIAKLSKLCEVINEVRKRGAAVVWFTSDVGDMGDGLVAPRTDYRLTDGNLRKVSRGSVDE